MWSPCAYNEGCGRLNGVLITVGRGGRYAMHELGMGSQKPFRKCARVVGEVLGKFHPHGDTAVYDSLVRMAQVSRGVRFMERCCYIVRAPVSMADGGWFQDFSLRDPLINGHGNFGSVDNDPPAAMRYTECKLKVRSGFRVEGLGIRD